MRRIFFGILLFVYLLVIAYLALRPLQPIPGLGYGDATLGFEEGAVHLRPGGALEERGHLREMRRALMASGQLTLALSLRTDTLEPWRPGRIIGYAGHSVFLNFELVQEGGGLYFALRTSNPGRHGLPVRLTVPAVLNADQWQQLVVTYDGSAIRCYMDGRLRGEHAGVTGDFSNWGRDQILIIGDEPAGGQAWRGLIKRLMIYDRALTAEEVARLAEGEDSPGTVIDHDLRSVKALSDLSDTGLRRLHYRNLFIIADAMDFQLHDFVANIVGFLPLGFLVYLILPLSLERRKILSVMLVPLAIGLLVSGSVEYMQRYIMGRVPSALDLVNNITGTLIGGLLAWLMNSSFRKWTRNRTGAVEDSETDIRLHVPE